MNAGRTAAPAEAAAAAATAPARGIRVVAYAWPWRARAVIATTSVLVLAISVGVLALTVGDYPISALDAVRSLVGVGHADAQTVVVDLRAPRVVVGLLVGAALGLAGALTQTIARNPLASPDVLGVTSGASLGAVGAIVLGGGTYAVTSKVLWLGVPACALAGGLVSSALVLGGAWRRGIDPYRLVLVGIGVGSILTAVTSWLLVVAQIADAGQASVWLAGSLSSRGWEEAVPLALAMAVLLPLGLALAGPLSTAQLGDETARVLGLRLPMVQLGAAVMAVALTCAAVAAAGAIGFVALVVPQVMLRLAHGSRPPLLASAAGGALLVAAADLAGRLLWTWELPVGLLTAGVGAPYLIWLLTRGRRFA